MSRIGILCLGLALTLGPSSASATWSVVAADDETGEVGAAVASCWPNVIEILGAVPGAGAVAAQAFFDERTLERAVELLGEGKTPTQVIEGVTDPEFDSATDKQYGVAVVGQSAANFTGAGVLQINPWAGDLLSDTHNVTAQGNVLVGAEVLDAALEAFENLGSEATLADRLVAALDAGSKAGGDNRCSAEATALSAALLVTSPDDEPESPSIRIAVDNVPENANPVAMLVTQYESSFGPIPAASGGSGGCSMSRRESLSWTAVLLAVAGVIVRRRDQSAYGTASNGR